MKVNYNKNASKLHKQIGEILTTHPSFKDHVCLQEYPVSSVNPRYTNKAHKFDWCIPSLMLVIECMGKQHYECTDFSGKQEDSGLSNFNEQKYRDRLKREAAIKAGYTYVEVPYDLDISYESLTSLIIDNFNPAVPIEREPEYKLEHKRVMKEKFRKAREESYKRAKETLAKIKENNS